VLDAGDPISLGGTTLRVLATPGHTPGCTVFTTEARERERAHGVVFYGCAGPNDGVKLVGNAKFPHLIEETRHSFARLAQLKPDIYLTMHPEFVPPHPLIDPAGWPKLIASQAADFERRVREQEEAAEPSRRGDAPPREYRGQ
jgi:metallo-beta-lactamase class B